MLIHSTPENYHSHAIFPAKHFQPNPSQEVKVAKSSGLGSRGMEGLTHTYMFSLNRLLPTSLLRYPVELKAYLIPLPTLATIFGVFLCIRESNVVL